MNRTVLGVIILLIGSIALGAIVGDRFFNLFTKTVPPAVLTSFNRGTAHGAFIAYGLILGVAIFAWSIAVVFIGPLFRRRKDESTPQRP
jgi:hypothetical protein